MNKKNIFIILSLIICTSIFLMWSKSSDNATILDEVRLKDVEKENSMFAIMVQQEANSENYILYEEETWPTEDYTFNRDKSGCLDSEGKKIEGIALTFDESTKKVKVETDVTSYCYIYFDKKSSKAGDVIKDRVNTEGLIQTSDDTDLDYRYVGDNTAEVDNYICFGTTNKDDCTPKDSNYLYRIIGIDENNKLKLIMNKALLTGVKWHSDGSRNAIWDSDSGKIESYLYKDLNGSTFLDNTAYVPNGWDNVIADTAWKIGDSNGEGSGKSDTGANVWKWESASRASTASKIGLMYLSDYYYALDGEGIINCSDGGSSINGKCKKAWIHLTNNGLSQEYTEWTMSRYGLNGSYYYAWRVASFGQSGVEGFDYTYAVRPVFYLTSNSVIKGGSGTSEDPYILESPEETGTRLVTEKFGEVPEGFKVIPTGDMYRFVGQQNDTVNNYVCFGAIDCNKEETNDHLYRIIGITSDGKIKIQKNSSITPTKWHSSYNDIKWSNSTMYKNTLQKDFYENETYVTESMKNKIDTTHTWNTGDVNGLDNNHIGTGDIIYKYESIGTKHVGAIGLAYLSDYYYAYYEDGTKNCHNEPYCKSWMIPSEYNTLWNGKDQDWTMTRYGQSPGVAYAAWGIYSYGSLGAPALDLEKAVRPVFYLKSDVRLTTNGDSSYAKGSLENPFIIE